MEDINIYKDYEAFVKENRELVTTLVKNNSKCIARFTPVIKVTDYLYHQHYLRKLSEEEEVFFSTGFDYVFDQFHVISTILESTFKNDINEMEKYGKDINLLLYINEFQSEALNSNEASVKKGIKLLDDLEDKVNTCLEKKENVPDEYFQILNDIIADTFEANGIELETIDEIFYEVALEYHLEDEITDTTFMDSVTEQMNKTRNLI